jgi:hypothetical protein
VIDQLISNGCKILYDHYQSSTDIQKEDVEKHKGTIQESLLKSCLKHRSTYVPTKRMIIASLHNDRLSNHLNSLPESITSS